MALVVMEPRWQFGLVGATADTVAFMAALWFLLGPDARTCPRHCGTCHPSTFDPPGNEGINGIRFGATSHRLRLTDLPQFNVFVFAFLLNYPWELLQVPLYQGMPEAAHWDSIQVCTRATLGDGVIMLLAYWSAALLVRDRW